MAEFVLYVCKLRVKLIVFLRFRLVQVFVLRHAYTIPLFVTFFYFLPFVSQFFLC